MFAGQFVQIGQTRYKDIAKSLIVLHHSRSRWDNRNADIERLIWSPDEKIMSLEKNLHLGLTGQTEVRKSHLRLTGQTGSGRSDNLTSVWPVKLVQGSQISWCTGQTSRNSPIRGRSCIFKNRICMDFDSYWVQTSPPYIHCWLRVNAIESTHLSFTFYLQTLIFPTHMMFFCVSTAFEGVLSGLPISGQH